MNKSVKNNTQRDVAEIIDALKTYDPDRIILFGSAATGTMKKYSDVDVLVVKDTDEPYWKRQIHATLLYRGWTPTDILVLTPKELDQAIADNRFFVTEEILKKGKVVYEKNHSAV